MKKISFNISDNIDIDEQEAKTILAANLYKNGKLSLGQASEMAGYTKRTFMELLGGLGVPLFDPSQSDIENDILHVKNSHQ